MLKSLHVRDLAIVNQADLDFESGLTALTGETGAGKSLIVDALLLTAGARSTADMVRSGAQRADVTAEFSISPLAAAWLEAREIEHEGDIIVRRTVGADGRSRAYLNSQLVPLQSLRELADYLIEIHGQQEFQQLIHPAAQRQLLDAAGVPAAALQQVSTSFAEYRNARDTLHSASTDASARSARIEHLRFQRGELADVGSREDIEVLLAERSRFANRGRLAGATSLALDCIDQAQGANAHDLLAKAAVSIRNFTQGDAALTRVAALLEEAMVATRESAQELQAFTASLDVDPARLEDMERRSASLEALARKHRISAAELPQAARAIEAELDSLESAGMTLADLENKLAQASAEYLAHAKSLSTARRIAARVLETRITELMQSLGMQGGRFAIEIGSRVPEYSAVGADDVEFLVSANPGHEPKPLAKVASGGELSRISLAIQVACASPATQICRVFDEVDAGIGGGVAEIVGRQLAGLGATGQILCVTHLPQVASQASAHFRVVKAQASGATEMRVERLSDEDRIEEIARMLAGMRITDKARSHAREMLNSRHEPASSHSVQRQPRRRKTI